MRVLVTGGAGFTGSQICEVLPGRGPEVVVLLADLSGMSKAETERKLALLVNHQPHRGW